jgi:chemotaxis protein MotA
MRFYLSIIIVIITLSLGLFFGGISIGIIFGIAEWVLILGIALGSFMISNPSAIFTQLIGELPKLIDEKPFSKADYLVLLSFMFYFFKQSNIMTPAELEAQIDNPADSPLFNKYPVLLENKSSLDFFQNHFRVLILGFQDIYEIESRMEADIEARKNYMKKIPKALNKLGDALPALGIIAAVLGVIGAMASAGAAPEVLGARVAAALVGTFAGVFLAYCIINPIAGFIEKFQDAELAFLESMKVGMISYMKGYSAPISVEFARQVISYDIQPTFAEVESVLYNSK